MNDVVEGVHTVVHTGVGVTGVTGGFLQFRKQNNEKHY